ncbi:hypothetical protein DBR32_04365 [Taibaiella sp. KBW10]|uniref:T9SS type A sorting domain-containing protein n=1 Tax=Taibaiella sp. KBW10 TaxID=2153357 RepID=UPI000F5B40CC|nr:T9SS type A sorting domain-containing protein [Taibaiella sp. KBW10]RQO31209.1 hypothetical protein DBR32_04365 [Taibaiella sp. KBW10]
MKKSVLILSALACIVFQSSAQISKGGIPLSFQHKIEYNTIPLSTYNNPDWEAYLTTEKEHVDFTRPYLAGLYAATDFGFPQSGQLITLDNGKRVWRAQIAVQDAPAIGLMYDRFQLPKGVSLYLSNENQKQVLGAFDNSNNDPSGVFITDAIQGSIVNVELDIDAGVALNTIQLHIDKAIVFHRAIEHLAQYTTAAGTQTIATAIDSALLGSSSVCMINAICPQGANYVINKKAAVQTLLPVTGGVSLCSGTLLNNTGNGIGACSNAYILTASHCEATGSLNNATFNQMMIRFNFEKSGCTSTEVPTAQTIVGVNVIARSSYSSSMSTSSIKGDFMLYQLRQTVPASYNATLSGWNNSAGIATTTSEPKKFIGFHHPAGDAKKLSYTYDIESTELGNNPTNTHWGMMLDGGYVAGGSSGSGLVNPEGSLIGIASVAGEVNPPSSCKVNAKGQTTDVNAMKFVTYSKFSYDWDYALDGAGANRKLKSWLDPNNSGVSTLGALNAANCAATSGTGINMKDDELSNNITVFPNPNTDGQVKIQYNLKSTADLQIMVYDVTGKVVYHSLLPKALNGTAQLGLQHLSNGMYVVKLSTETGFATKKIMIQQ